MARAATAKVDADISAARRGLRKEVERRKRSTSPGISLGRVFGFQIDLDYSWFVIFFLILGTFTGIVFPMYVPGLGLPPPVPSVPELAPTPLAPFNWLEAI